jgi:hypothetical protein
MFLVHQMGVAMFRLMGAIGRTLVIATSMGSLAVLIIVTMSGFVLAYPQVETSTTPLPHPTFIDFVGVAMFCKATCCMGDCIPEVICCHFSLQGPERLM